LLFSWLQENATDAIQYRSPRYRKCQHLSSSCVESLFSASLLPVRSLPDCTIISPPSFLLSFFVLSFVSSLLTIMVCALPLQAHSLLVASDLSHDNTGKLVGEALIFSPKPFYRDCMSMRSTLR